MSHVGTVERWDVPSISLPVPDWLPVLAESLAGGRFDGRGVFEAMAPNDEFARRKQQLLGSPSAAGTDSWTKWLLSDAGAWHLSPLGGDSDGNFAESAFWEPFIASLTGPAPVFLTNTAPLGTSQMTFPRGPQPAFFTNAAPTR
jgi:hypothetical protein